MCTTTSNRHSLARESGSWVGRGCGHMVQCEWRCVVANLYKFVTSNDLFFLNRELYLKSFWIRVFFGISGGKQHPICSIFYLKFQHYDVLSQHFESVISTYPVYYFNIYFKSVELVYSKCWISFFLDCWISSKNILNMILHEPKQKKNKAPCSRCSLLALMAATN